MILVNIKTFKMKKGILAVTAIAFALSIQACKKINGDGPVVTETRSLSGFSSINVGLSGNVYYNTGNEYKVEIHAQKNIVDAIETPVGDGELKVHFDRHKIVGHHDPIDIYITAPEVTAFDVNGSANVSVLQAIHPQNMDLNVSGSGSITINELQTNYLHAKISGSGDVAVLGGSAQQEKTEISGSGNANLLNIPVHTAETHTSGSGTTKVNVSEKLDVHISGSGDVYYKGNPTLSVSISGSGKVKPW